MVKVTLLGDSIRLSYGQKVSNILGDDYEVFQPEENCRFAKYTLRGLFDWSNQMQGSNIVHWNNGLWDVCNLFGDGTFTNKKEYLETILRIADILLEKYDKVIFATTTPVTEFNQYNNNRDIKEFNDLVVPLLKEKGVIINDLYSLISSNIDKYVRKDDNIHLTEEGIEVCSNQVVSTIKKVAKTLSNVKSNATTSKSKNGAPV